MDSGGSKGQKGKSQIRSDFEIGFSIPKNFYDVVERIVVCERIFYSRCQLDKTGKRTNIPRVMPASDFNTYRAGMNPVKKHPRG